MKKFFIFFDVIFGILTLIALIFHYPASPWAVFSGGWLLSGVMYRAGWRKVEP